jgi:3-carboxy-cis,cis-muconate cycloisomerase
MSSVTFPACTVVDSLLFRNAFGTPAMRAIFSDCALIQRCIDVEIALARAEARCGVIPAEVAGAIARESAFDRLDLNALQRETENVGYPIYQLVHQLSAMCGEAGRYVHWGATTQDVMDTANVLQLRAALTLVDADIRELRSILARLAQKHRDTPMAGRTHLQQALPVTFGYKVAIWLAMFDRHQERLAELCKRVLVCCCCSSEAPPAPWQRSATRALRCSKRWPTSSALGCQPRPGTWHAMASLRP